MIFPVWRVISPEGGGDNTTVARANGYGRRGKTEGWKANERGMKGLAAPAVAITGDGMGGWRWGERRRRCGG